MIIERFKTIDITKELEEYEDRKQVRLPEQYRKFLLKYNGGETIDTSFDINGYSNSIRAFLGFIDRSRSWSINNSATEFVLENYIKSKVLLIAELGVGDMLAIGVGSRNYGQIFALDHERGYKATKVGSSFNEFIQQVISIPVDVDNLAHPDDKIKRYEEKYNKKPPEVPTIATWVEQYESMRNAIYEEVELED